MILGVQQNQFHYFWTSTQIYLEFTNLPQKLIWKMLLKKKRSAANYLAQQPKWPATGSPHVQQASPTGPQRERSSAFFERAPDLASYYTEHLCTILQETRLAAKPPNYLILTMGWSPVACTQRRDFGRRSAHTPAIGMKHQPQNRADESRGAKTKPWAAIRS